MGSMAYSNLRVMQDLSRQAGREDQGWGLGFGLPRKHPLYPKVPTRYCKSQTLKPDRGLAEDEGYLILGSFILRILLFSVLYPGPGNPHRTLGRAGP